MSRRLIIDPEVRKAFDRLRGEDDNTSWILCGYKPGSNNALEVIGCGPGGMPELIARLPKKIAWGAFKVVGVDDRVGSCVSYRPRLVFIWYNPDKDEGGKSISPIQRARMGGHKGQIKQIVQSTVDIEIDSPADLTEELVIAKLETAGEAFPPTRYEFSAFQATGRLVISEPQQNDGNIGASSRARTPTSSPSSLSLAFPAVPATATAFAVTGGETPSSEGISAAIATLMDQHLTASSTEETSSIKPVALSHGLGKGLELGLEPGLGPALAPTSISSMVSALSRRSSMKIDVAPPSATPRSTISGLNSMGSPSLSALSSMSAEDDDSNPSTTTTTTSTAAADSATATATATSTSADLENAKPSMAGRCGADWKGSLLSHSISISRSISESDDPLLSPGLRSAFMRRSSVRIDPKDRTMRISDVLILQMNVLLLLMLTVIVRGFTEVSCSPRLVVPSPLSAANHKVLYLGSYAEGARLDALCRSRSKRMSMSGDRRANTDKLDDVADVKDASIMNRLAFVSSNEYKIREVMMILGSDFPYEVKSHAVDLSELQATPIEVSRAKCREAAEICEGPVIVEDTSLCFNALNGLPGPYIKWFYEGIGNLGLAKLLDGFEDKTAYAQCVLSFSLGPGRSVKTFVGSTDGSIVYPAGPEGFGWDPIFIPAGQEITFAQMTREEKNKLSHRFKAFRQFKAYVNQRTQSS